MRLNLLSNNKRPIQILLPSYMNETILQPVIFDACEIWRPWSY